MHNKCILTAVTKESDVDVVTKGNQPERVANKRGNK